VCVVALTLKKKHGFVLRDQFWGLALLNSSGFLIQEGAALERKIKALFCKYGSKP